MTDNRCITKQIQIKVFFFIEKTYTELAKFLYLCVRYSRAILEIAHNYIMRNF